MKFNLEDYADEYIDKYGNTAFGLALFGIIMGSIVSLILLISFASWAFLGLALMFFVISLIYSIKFVMYSIKRFKEDKSNAKE